MTRYTFTGPEMVTMNIRMISRDTATATTRYSDGNDVHFTNITVTGHLCG